MICKKFGYFSGNFVIIVSSYIHNEHSYKTNEKLELHWFICCASYFLFTRSI